jgi:hypothetical protein
MVDAPLLIIEQYPLKQEEKKHRVYPLMEGDR